MAKKSWKNHPQKLLRIPQIHFSSLLPWTPKWTKQKNSCSKCGLLTNCIYNWALTQSNDKVWEIIPNTSPKISTLVMKKKVHQKLDLTLWSDQIEYRTKSPKIKAKVLRWKEFGYCLRKDIGYKTKSPKIKAKVNERRSDIARTDILPGWTLQKMGPLQFGHPVFLHRDS